MAIISTAVAALLAREAEEILLRILQAAEPEAKVLATQFGERLAHLAERLGEKAFGEIQEKLKASLASKPAPAATAS